MPVIEFADGTRMGQTCSMARYIGKKYELQPTDPYEKWLNDAWIEDYNDQIFGKFLGPLYLMATAPTNTEGIQ